MLCLLTVIEMMKMDPDMMVYSLWVMTVIGVLAGLTMAVAAAVFAVINSAITPISALAGIPGLYFWNISASECHSTVRYQSFYYIAFPWSQSPVKPSKWQVLSKSRIRSEKKPRSCRVYNPGNPCMIDVERIFVDSLKLITILSAVPDLDEQMNILALDAVGTWTHLNTRKNNVDTEHTQPM